MDKKSYIKEHSWGGFKSGVKYSAYLYLGATVASLLISLTIAPIFPFVLLASNPIAWAVLGVAFVISSGMALAIMKPLFHLTYDYINKEKYQAEAPSSLLRDVEVSKRELFLDKKRYSTFVHSTVSGNYQCWMRGWEITDIAEKKYGYPDEDNGVMFVLLPLCNNNEKMPNSSEAKRKIVFLDQHFFYWYRKRIEETGGLDRPIFTLILFLKNHYVTLVIDYDNTSERFRAYYCNPFGGIYNVIDRLLLECLEKGEFFSLRKEDIKVSKTRQQKDSYNCGMYALENAKIITDMMKAGRSLDEIDSELRRNVFTSQQLEEKRREFAKVLIDSVSHMSDDEIKGKFKYWGDVLIKEGPSKGICRMV